MKKSIILVSKDFFICNNEKCYFDKINEVSKLFKSHIKIVILEEDLWVKQYDNNINRFKIRKFVDFIIENDFPQNGDILYDYKKKNKVISIYYIKGAKRIEMLAENAKNLEIKPIQLIIKEAMRELLKTKGFTCKVLIKFQDFYYYISFKEGLFNHGMVKEIKEYILNKLLEECDDKELYVDDSASDIVSLNKEIKFIKINIGRFINENIYEKQKFYSRKNSL